ncbi:MAG TPA: hypothetical protein DCM60_09125 [Nitrospina sp.]|jgi:hypothetical protein|nr:hypothetical protein [Nitrospina sp.]|tara:strand:+ start:1451 stop:1651 length:201 start_codon:yes stop_codon:yes gene_type:complete
MFYNESGRLRSIHDWQGGGLLKVLCYLILFFLSFLVFESISVIVAVGVALFALYYFTVIKPSGKRL